MKKVKAAIFIGIFLVIISAIFVKTDILQESFVHETGEEELPAKNEVMEVSAPKPNPTVTIAAAGDVIMHAGPRKAGFNEETGIYDFSGIFDEIKGEIQSADFGMINLETTLAGKEQKYTGYPRFNSPDEIADALKNAGFNIITTANNHTLDRNAHGVLRTLKVLKEKRLIPLGTYESQDDSKKLLTLDKNGIKITFLAYTYGTNGIPVPKDMPYIVNIIDEQKILSDLEKAREVSDAIVVYLHYGDEYQRTPSKFQKDLSYKILENGADIIVGSHPHVIQPSEVYKQEMSDGQIVKKYIAYSLGNFVSGQRFPYTEEGNILKFTFEKDLENGETYLKDVNEINTWVDKFIRDGKMRYVIRFGKKPQET